MQQFENYVSNLSLAILFHSVLFSINLLPGNNTVLPDLVHSSALILVVLSSAACLLAFVLFRLLFDPLALTNPLVFFWYSPLPPQHIACPKYSAQRFLLHHLSISVTFPQFHLPGSTA